MTLGTTGSTRILVALLGAAVVGLAAAGCGAPPAGEELTLAFPQNTEANFVSLGSLQASVSDALNVSCGTLDCHGQIGRNLRLYGMYGLRLDPAESPGVGGGTTDAERLQNYISVISIEPEKIALVLQEGGVNPERLTIVRKGRGTEHHKGYEAMVPGGATDTCFLSWLAGAVNEQACAQGAQVFHPQDPEVTGAPPPAGP